MDERGNKELSIVVEDACVLEAIRVEDLGVILSRTCDSFWPDDLHLKPRHGLSKHSATHRLFPLRAS